MWSRSRVQTVTQLTEKDGVCYLPNSGPCYCKSNTGPIVPCPGRQCPPSEYQAGIKYPPPLQYILIPVLGWFPGKYTYGNRSNNNYEQLPTSPGTGNQVNENLIINFMWPKYSKHSQWYKFSQEPMSSWFSSTESYLQHFPRESILHEPAFCQLRTISPKGN